MTDPYTVLQVTPEATPSEIKLAYHRQLRQFPAHSHPKEFQQLRAAYEAIRSAGEHRGDPLRPGPLMARLDPEALATLNTRVREIGRAHV